MMKRIIADTATVPFSDCSRMRQLSARYARASTTVASAPMAADSVGVPQPAAIAPTTTAKIETSGSTYCSSGR